MKYANKSQNKHDRRISIRALLVILALVTSITLPTLRPPVTHAQASGTVVGWGDNSVGQLNIPVGLSGVVAISAGLTHSLALKSDGTVVGWGDNGSGKATPPAGLVNVTAIAAGGSELIETGHSLALKSDGTIVAWGDDSAGQATPPAGLSGVVAISARVFHSLTLKSDGTIVGWGAFGLGTPPAGLSGVMAISAGGVHSLALKSDGTVVGWGDNSRGQLNIPSGLSGVVAISAGAIHSLALVSAFDLDDLIALVNGLNIHQGIQSSLLAKLNAAAAALAAGNTATACTKLQDFINECNAQSGKKLSVEQANELIGRANEIRDSLGCP